MITLKRLLGPHGPSDRLRSRLTIALPYCWALFFLLLPLLFVLKISFSADRFGMPPYADMLSLVKDGVIHPQGGAVAESVSGGLYIRATLANFTTLFTDNLYLDAYVNSLRVAALSALLCLVVGYPMAYGIARAGGRWRAILLALVILPFWTSFLIRVYAWVGLMQTHGIINNLLMSLQIIHEPLVLLNTPFAVYVGIVYSYLPFMILPLLNAIEKVDRSLLEAAADLGRRPWQAFIAVTLPLTMPGILAGFMLVFIPAIGEYVIPELLGGPNTLMIGRVLWNEFALNHDWPLASALSIAILLVVITPIMLLQYFRKK